MVVARTGAGAKSRLGDVLDAGERSALAVAMLADVLAAVSRAAPLGTVAVLDPPRAPLGGPRVIPDPAAGLNEAVQAGVSAAVAEGAATVVVLPGDVPLLEAEDIAELLSLAGAPRSVVVAADRSGSGTNALVLRPPGVIAPAFGGQSAPRHVAAARAAGAEVAVAGLARVALDIDAATDLAELLRRTTRGATASALRELDMHARLRPRSA